MGRYLPPTLCGKGEIRESRVMTDAVSGCPMTASAQFGKELERRCVWLGVSGVWAEVGGHSEWEWECGQVYDLIGLASLFASLGLSLP